MEDLPGTGARRQTYGGLGRLAEDRVAEAHQCLHAEEYMHVRFCLTCARADGEEKKSQQPY